MVSHVFGKVEFLKVGCAVCGAHAVGDTEAEAIRSWNTRQIDTFLQDAADSLAPFMKNYDGTNIPNLASQVHKRLLLALGNG